MSEEAHTPQTPRGPSLRNIKSFLTALSVELALAALYASTFFLSEPCDRCSAAWRLLEFILFAYSLIVMWLIFFWWLLIPLLLTPLAVGLARDYRRAARLDGGD